MKALLKAIGFMTIIPVGTDYQSIGGDESAEMAEWFPIVGLIPGLILTFCAAAADRTKAADICAFVALAATVFVTGALHLDGLADWVDGFGGHSPEERYRIMKDSRIGTFGAIAVVIALLGKYIALHRLFMDSAYLWVLIVVPVISRWSLLATMWNGSHANPQGGTATAFLSGVSASSKTLAKGTALAFSIFIPITCFKYLWLWPIAILVAIGIRVDSRRRLGGISGDVLGAQCELTEILMLFILAASGTK